ncbi:hypothetical protein C7K43_01600 [Tetragenococcus koreensis]|nr:hypothetical protein C7K43_01600 [Tetragenococcus koreensis]
MLMMKEQAIIVLGYPVKSLEHLLQRRLQLAQKDAEKNQINCIIVSGKGREGINEAEYMANWLVENGYEGQIIKERDSWDTIENLRFCNEICIKNHISSVKIITSWFHLSRVNLLADQLLNVPFSLLGAPGGSVELLKEEYEVIKTLQKEIEEDKL